MRDQMKKSDLVLFYHSNANPPAVAGVARVVRESYPDHTCWDPNDKHYDPKSSAENPRWFMVDIKLVEVFAEPISLETLRGIRQLAKMELLRKGSRLSVQPVRKSEFEAIVQFSQTK
jgi:predicted RNA-binding protein with PUA-like domain